MLCPYEEGGKGDKIWAMKERNDGITRRDFLNGVALTIGASMLPAQVSRLYADEDLPPELSADYYPPSLTGLRGSHDGSYEAAHQLRDGSFPQKLGNATRSGQEYDLVIVGGGISGLSAAYFYRKMAGPDARILILDNHDDFGGHAKRNEFRIDNRTILSYGGTWSIDSPAAYSSVAKDLIRDLGIDVGKWNQVWDRNLYSSLGLHSTVFFDRETFGVDRMVPFFSSYEDEGEERQAEVLKRFLAEAPLSDTAKADFQRLIQDEKDYMPDLTSDQKKAKLARISYRSFLTDFVKVDPAIVKLFHARFCDLYGVGIDAVPAQDAWGLGAAGFEGMKLDPSFGKGMNLDAKHDSDGGNAYFFHFPDGNATIARKLIHHLIPDAIPGSGQDDIINARCNYGSLDQSTSKIRIRLNSTVVRVEHTQKGSDSNDVQVTYAKGKSLESVHARHCILACWHSMIPFICPELPEPQKEALRYGAKVPLLYTNVLLSNWKPFVKAQTHSVYCPGSYHYAIHLDLPVNIGGYESPRNPEEPILVHMYRTPNKPGLPARTQHKIGRGELLKTKFETYEGKIREQLSRAFGPYGFDADQDIRAITVNRWAHGYAYQYNSLFDPFWLEGAETPCERARKQFGSISIANSDAGAYAYTDCAIDHAHCAVSELLGAKG